MYLLALFILNILLISLPLAIFEISIEGTSGWGSAWPKDAWYAKVAFKNSRLVKLIAKAGGLPYFTNYHLLMFGLALPAIFVAEYFFITQNIAFLLATYVAVSMIEDFLWFLLNWKFDAFTQLVKGPNGSIWWHMRWTKISRDKYLPTSYFGGSVIVAILLAMSIKN